MRYGVIQWSITHVKDVNQYRVFKKYTFENTATCSRVLWVNTCPLWISEVNIHTEFQSILYLCPQEGALRWAEDKCLLQCKYGLLSVPAKNFHLSGPDVTMIKTYPTQEIKFVIKFKILKIFNCVTNIHGKIGWWFLKVMASPQFKIKVLIHANIGLSSKWRSSKI